MFIFNDMPNSNIYRHITENKHNIGDLDRDVTILHNSKDTDMLKVLEKLEIRQAVLEGRALMNVQLDIDGAGNILIDKCCGM